MREEPVRRNHPCRTTMWFRPLQHPELGAIDLNVRVTVSEILCRFSDVVSIDMFAAFGVVDLQDGEVERDVRERVRVGQILDDGI